MLQQPAGQSSNPDPKRPDPPFHSIALYIDLEWTCWDCPPPPGIKQEIIEIGVVALDLKTLKIIDEAAHFVRPRRWDISQKCTYLTGITDDDIRKAKPLREVISHFEKQFNPKGKPSYAWGDDGSVLAGACKREGVKNPVENSMNLARIFQGVFAAADQVGLESAVQMLGMSFDGFAHGALSDARNAALVHSSILAKLRCRNSLATTGEPLSALRDPS